MVERQPGTLRDLKNGEHICITSIDETILDQPQTEEIIEPHFAPDLIPEMVAEIFDETIEQAEEVIPDLDTEDWYVKLTPEEIFNVPGKGPAPLLCGLRRLAKPFIFREESRVNQLIVVPREYIRTLRTTNSNGDVMSSNEEMARHHFPMASVTFFITLHDGRTFSDSADAYNSSCNKGFGLFPTAVASARAEARTLRKILNIKQHAAEEMTDRDAEEELTPDDTSPIKPEQAKLIEKMLQSLEITLQELLENTTTREIFAISELTTGEARQALRLLNDKKKNNKRTKK